MICYEIDMKSPRKTQMMEEYGNNAWKSYESYLFSILRHTQKPNDFCHILLPLITQL